LYIDKTKVIYDLVDSGSVYFLSRPRRFGKSLLISTLGELFKGNKALFEGLYIYDQWDWTRKHPVIRIDWTIIRHGSPEEIEISLCGFLQNIARIHELTLTNQYASDLLVELIALLHRKTGEKAVVLVDEYDKPITDHLLNPDVMEGNKKALHDFYQVLKGADDHLQFVFLTGVSKFSGVSIFSGLNNINDVTLDDKYASICGYTQQELEQSFPEQIEELAKKTDTDRAQVLEGIRKWYNGYSWDGKTPLYNPFSTLLLFDKKEFGNYWFRTGTPTFLIELLKKRNQLAPILQPIIVHPILFESFDPANINEVALLFQTGYLTVKKKEIVGIRPQYTLEIPNQEVEESLLEYLLNAYSAYPLEQGQFLKERIQQQLLSQDTEGLEKSIREMLAYVPYPLHIKREAYYHSLLLVWLRMLGFDIEGEITTNTGRIDAVWKTPGRVIIAEVTFQAKKAKITDLLDAAILQIREKKYYERFLSEPQVSLLGIAFAGKEIGCRIESLIN
jgi:hypothetical protein